MPTWKKDAKEFEVSVTFNEHRGYQVVMPKPIMEILGDPKRLRFVVSARKHVEVMAAGEE